MTSCGSISPQPIVWTKDMVIKKGFAFLTRNKDKMKIYQEIWNASKEGDFYGKESRKAGEKLRTLAVKSKKEVEALNNEVMKLLKIESKIDPTSETTKRLTKFASATFHSLSYLTAVTETIYYPTLSNKIIKYIAVDVLWNLTFFGTTLGAAAYVVGYPLPDGAFDIWKVSMVTMIGFMGLTYFYKQATQAEADRLQVLLENSLTSSW